MVLLFSKLLTISFSQNRIFNERDVDPKPIAIVFGAGLWRDGSPTPVLRDRVKTAVNLYLTGKVDKLLMSGDNRFKDYNEPAAMRNYALSLGIPDQDIVLDFAGRRTYDTCFRAKVIFGVKDAILVTQKFHSPRAIYICNKLGLNSIGVPADQREYRRRSLLYWNIRETFATLVAIWEVHIIQPHPVLGKPEPIFTNDINLKDKGDFS